jgi:hypothetical protein
VVEVASAEVVPSDVVVLGAGDILSCDVPSPQARRPAPADAPLAERYSALLGSHVVSGRGEAVAMAVVPRAPWQWPGE